MVDYSVGTNIVHFGCWNSGYCGTEFSSPISRKDNGITRITKSLYNLTNGIKDGTIDRIYNKSGVRGSINYAIIAGGNYYPSKYNTSKYNASKYNSNSKNNKRTLKISKTSKMVFDKNNFNSGFVGLQRALSNVVKLLLLGNYDLFDVIKYINDDTNNTRNTKKIKKSDEKCISLKKQLEFVKKSVENYDIFTIPEKVASIFPSDAKAVVIMIDTTLYEIRNKVLSNVININDLQCYKLLNTGIDIETPTNNSNSQNKTIAFLDTLIKNQRNEIIKLLVECNNKGLTNIIFGCHHPIVSVKKNERRLYNNILDEVYCHPEVIDYLIDKSIYHLCAYTHIYQNGIININLQNNKKISINQHIVGTGGSFLDKLDTNIDTNNKINFNNISGKAKIAYDIEYVVDIKENMQKSTYGYLLINLNNSTVNCKFVDVGRSVLSGG
jgi:hypothetical protein